jgi:hypothetical protein
VLAVKENHDQVKAVNQRSDDMSRLVQLLLNDRRPTRDIAEIDDVLRRVKALGYYIF